MKNSDFVQKICIGSKKPNKNHFDAVFFGFFRRFFGFYWAGFLGGFFIANPGHRCKPPS
jgi:hypothetical protein